jgi:hypothetical protein
MPSPFIDMIVNLIVAVLIQDINRQHPQLVLTLTITLTKYTPIMWSECDGCVFALFIASFMKSRSAAVAGSPTILSLNTYLFR